MKKLSLNRSSKRHQKDASQNSSTTAQTKISSFFDVFKTPENKKENALKQANEDVIIENTPDAEKKDDVVKKRKLFKLKKQTSKIGGLFGASTASLISGNLDTKASKVCTPPKCEETRKRPLQITTPECENKSSKLQRLSTSPCPFQPASSQHISTPSTSQSSFTKLKEHTPTQNIVDDDEEEEEQEAKCEIKSVVQEKSICQQGSLSSSYGRHVVESVELSERGRQMILTLKDQSNNARKCILEGSWMDTKVKEGDIVNVLNIDKDDEIVINDLKGLIVVNPDLLISGTSIVSTLFCMRKAVLNERFKGQEGSSRTMLVGTLVHELLQESLKNALRSKEDISKQLEKCLQSEDIIKSLMGLKMTQEEMRKEVEPFLPHVLFFIEKYVMGKNGIQVPEAAFANTSSQRQRTPMSSQSWPGTVEAIKDIEENIWSPRLGIKGKVDLTVQVKLQNRDPKGRICKTVPLELKTGRPSGSAEHRGQLIMYSMMMSERRPDPEAGLLLYLRTSSLQEVRAGIHEMRGLVQMRNQLAVHLLDDHFQDLPDPINAKRACKECGHLNSCAMYLKLADKVPAEPHAMAELVPTVLDHLTKEDIQFFDRWSKMNSLESGEARKGSRLKSLWCSSPSYRELQGQAMSDLNVGKDGITFQKSNGSDFGASQSIFQTGDMVIVSSLNGELALAQGTVIHISHNSIRINLDKPLLNRLQGSTYVIDKFEYSMSSGNWLTLAKLMSNSDEAKMLRQVVIAKQPGTFVSGLPKEVALMGKHILRPLNRVQQKAVFKTIMAEKFVLLKGMPGSGKTTMIVALIRLLVKMGKSILLTSYTHSAIDNVLLKLLKEENGESCFLRLGRKNRVHPDLEPFSEDFLIKSKNIKETVKLMELYQSQPVVAITCLGANSHPGLGNLRKFDYCIVDEAGQSLLLSALGPLFYADKFVLVGDPAQLPPVVKSASAKSMGMDVSLMSHLEDKDNTIPLSLQYRMNRDIQDIANFMTYNGELECGNETVAKRQVSLPSSWPEFVPEKARNVSVAFFDTSLLGNTMEAQDELGISNVGEAELVAKLAKIAVKMKTQESKDATLGIIAPFRAQVSTLKKMVVVAGKSDISTVDQFQGRDKDLIIYSCTRTKPKRTNAKTEDDIMSDWRRLNVAVTRAKSRLWMIGNVSALKTYAPFAKLLEHLNSKELIFPLQQVQ